MMSPKLATLSLVRPLPWPLHNLVNPATQDSTLTFTSSPNIDDQAHQEGRSNRKVRCRKLWSWIVNRHLAVC